MKKNKLIKVAVAGFVATVLSAGVAFSQAIPQPSVPTLETDRAGGVARASIPAAAQVSAVAAQSRLPSQNDRVGYASALYDFDVHGGAIGTIELDVVLPDNSIVVGYTIQAISALTSTGATTVALGTTNADSGGDGTGITDAFGATVAKAALGADAVASDRDDSAPFKVTYADDSNPADGVLDPQSLAITLADGVVTAGELLIVLELVQGN